ncbi:MAG: HPr family phosphocarrier protein [Myxococcales bacterium]
MSEARGKFLIVNKLGMHARAATKLVQTASRFKADIQVQKDGHSANAKSVMGVLLLCGHQGSSVEVSAQGEDAEEAVRTIGELIDNRFGESS